MRDGAGPAGVYGRRDKPDVVTTLSPEARRLLDDVAASARLEGQELPADDLELARAYLADDIDAATFQQRVRELVAGTRRPAQSV